MRRHELADFFGDKEEEVDHMFRRAVEFPPEDRVLRRDPDRAGVQMALAHHHAAHGDQRCRGETEFLRPEERGDDHVASGLDLPVCLNARPAAQVVEEQHLLRLGDSQLPRNAGVFDRRQRRRTRSPAVSADEDHYPHVPWQRRQQRFPRRPPRQASRRSALSD